MEKNIYKPKISENKDQDVPEFGGFLNEELKYPDVRELKEDLFNNDAYEGLKDGSLKRALYLSYGLGDIPHVQFPNGEHFQHIPFSKEHWERYGNMESEYSRLHFMLDKYPSKRFPDSFNSLISPLNASLDVLDAWNHTLPSIKKMGGKIYDDLVVGMNTAREHDPMGYKNNDRGACVSDPLLYKAMGSPDIEKILLEKGLEQVGSELLNGNAKNVSSFLSLYNRIKDPITPLRSILSNQVEYFLELYKNSHKQIKDADITITQEKILIAQLALESSFLALPEVKNIAGVVYGGHHELPYIYVDIARLPRGEYANPNRVIEVISELIQDSQQHNDIVATPITVSYSQEPHQAEPRLFIVDGNNRSTAILLMKYFDYGDYNAAQIYNKSNIRSFIELYDLDIAWERDLILALENIPNDRLHDVLENKAIIQGFAHGHAPALLVQEPNFHTVAVAHSEGDNINLLQPLHQSIYNQTKYPMAIPSKQQSHGRAGGNDIRLSIRRINEKV